MTDINIGAITEALNDKSDRDLRNVDTTAKADAVIDYQEPTAENDYMWYRKYKSGWVEQGGVSVHTSDADYTVTMPIEMTDTNYTVLTTVAPLSSPYTSQVSVNRLSAFDLTTTSFKLRGDTSATIQRHCWQVSGKSAN